MADITYTGKKKVKLKDLHIQFIPYVTPIDMWNEDMGLKGSPHVELMNELLEDGFVWGNIKSSRYVRERMRRFKIGFTRWTEPYIIYHIQNRRYATLTSLKNRGWDDKKSGDKPIVVLEEPFWKTRFGIEKPWLGGMEIWDGAGRCSSMMALGKKEVTVMMAKDAKPGTRSKGKFEKKLDCCGDKVWSAS